MLYSKYTITIESESLMHILNGTRVVIVHSVYGKSAAGLLKSSNGKLHTIVLDDGQLFRTEGKLELTHD